MFINIQKLANCMYSNTRMYINVLSGEFIHDFKIDKKEASNVLEVPVIDNNEIKRKYVEYLGNRPLIYKLKNTQDPEYSRILHWFIEDNRLTDDWSAFENKQYIQAAILWCEKNEIRYTLKNEG